MIPALREAFNHNFRLETYQQLLKSLEATAGAPIAFRVSETASINGITSDRCMNRRVALASRFRPLLPFFSGLDASSRDAIADAAENFMSVSSGSAAVREYHGTNSDLFSIGITKLLYSRREVEAPHRVNAFKIADSLSKVLQSHVTISRIRKSTRAFPFVCCS